MPRRRMLHVTLALAAIVGFGLFILACTGWLSWSPDGSQIVFGYYDPNAGDKGEYRIALYDNGTGKVRALNPEILSVHEKGFLGQWKQDGSGLFVFATKSDQKLHVMDVSASTGEIIKEVEVPTRESDSQAIVAAVEMQGILFINVDPLTRLDLATSEVTQIDQDHSKGLFVFPLGDTRLFYLKTDDDLEEFGLGYVDPQTLALNPLFQIKNDDVRLRGSKGFRPLLAVEPGNSRIAISSMREKKDDIVICNETGIQNVLSPKLPFSNFHIGNLQWSRDGKHLYASVINPLRDDFVQYSVAEIDAESGRARVIPIAEVNTKGDSDFDEMFYLLLQVWVSPDQHTIATSTANLQEGYIAEKDRALYLIDMSRQDQKVTKIPAPLLKKKGN